MRDLDGGGGDGHRALADRGLEAHPLGDGEGRLHDALERLAHHAGIAPETVARLDLAQYLGLAEDEAVKRGGDGKKVLERFLALERIELIRQIGRRYARRLGEPRGDDFRHLADGALGGDDLGAVTGGDHHRLGKPRGAQRFKEGRHGGVFHEQGVAKGQGSGLVIGADHHRVGVYG